MLSNFGLFMDKQSPPGKSNDLTKNYSKCLVDTALLIPSSGVNSGYTSTVTSLGHNMSQWPAVRHSNGHPTCAKLHVNSNRWKGFPLFSHVVPWVGSMLMNQPFLKLGLGCGTNRLDRQAGIQKVPNEEYFVWMLRRSSRRCMTVPVASWFVDVSHCLPLKTISESSFPVASDFLMF
jgi:hypothetical protein